MSAIRPYLFPLRVSVALRVVLLIAEDFEGVWNARELFGRDRKFDELFVIHRTSNYISCVSNFCVFCLA